MFLSNPGLAKTTNLSLWAEEMGYAVTTLIGSQRVREEVLGYMINDKGQAATLKPDWFDEVIDNHKKGKKTVLFIDELSTAPEDVQSSLLQLSFSRKIGGKDNYLPDDVLIVAAANYKENLPPQMNIMAPTLNRYMLVNLTAQDMNSLVDEFMLDEDEFNSEMLKFDNIEITDEMNTKIKDLLGTSLKSLFSAYNVKDDAGGNTISAKAKSFDGIYDTEGDVYNFVSGRSISYLKRVTKAIVSTGLHNQITANIELRDKIMLLVYGLIGAGTCTFDAQTQKKYLKQLKESYMSILNQLSGQAVKKKSVKIDFDKLTVGQAINTWQLHNENPTQDNFDENFLKLYTKICTQYDIKATPFAAFVKQMHDNPRMVTEFIGDMQRIDHLVLLLKECDLPSLKTFVEKLNDIQTVWEAYKLQSMMMVKG